MARFHVQIGRMFAEHAFSCLGFDSFDLKVLKDFPSSKIQKSIDSNAVTATLEGAWPPPKTEVMRQILGALGVKPDEIAQLYFVASVSGGSSSDSAGPMIPGDAEGLVRHFCTSCHGGSEAAAGQLPLDDLRALAQFVVTAYDKPVVDLIETSVMPPISAERAAKIGLTGDRRATIVKALRAAAP